jgi:hypothetical protein
LVGNNEGKKPLGKPRSKWENNIKMNFREIVLGSCGLDKSGLGY